MTFIENECSLGAPSFWTNPCGWTTGQTALVSWVFSSFFMVGWGGGFMSICTQTSWYSYTKWLWKPVRRPPLHQCNYAHYMHNETLYMEACAGAYFETIEITILYVFIPRSFVAGGPIGTCVHESVDFGYFHGWASQASGNIWSNPLRRRSDPKRTQCHWMFCFWQKKTKHVLVSHCGWWWLMMGNRWNSPIYGYYMLLYGYYMLLYGYYMVNIWLLYG